MSSDNETTTVTIKSEGEAKTLEAELTLVKVKVGENFEYFMRLEEDGRDEEAEDGEGWEKVTLESCPALIQEFERVIQEKEEAKRAELRKKEIEEKRQSLQNQRKELEEKKLELEQEIHKLDEEEKALELEAGKGTTSAEETPSHPVHDKTKAMPVLTKEIQTQSQSSGRSSSTRKRKRSNNYPKRPISAFFFFCNEERPNVRTQDPSLTFSELSKEMGKRWLNLPVEARKRYESMAECDKQRYQREVEQCHGIGGSG